LEGETQASLRKILKIIRSWGTPMGRKKKKFESSIPFGFTNSRLRGDRKKERAERASLAVAVVWF